MFTDGREVPDGASLVTDVCIVGAGAAGITMARALAGRKVRVALIESGGFKQDPETRSLSEGKATGYPRLDQVRLRYFGGSTNHWAGRCRPNEENEFLERPWIPNSGWPFERGELDRYYAKASTLCEIPPARFDLDAAERLLSAQRIQLDPKVFESALFTISPPTRFAKRYRAPLEVAKNITVYLHSNVLELETDEGGRTVRSARIRCISGTGYRMRAHLFAVCLGGIENPRLLLLSNTVQKAGLGNQHDLVGRYFMEHPSTEPSVFLPSNPTLDLRLYAQHKQSMTWLSLRPEITKREEIGNYTAALVRLRKWESKGQASLDHILDNVAAFDFPDDLGEHLQNVVRDLDLLAEDATRGILGEAEKPSFYAVIPSTEMAPNPASRVTLDSEVDLFGQARARLDIRFSDLDRRTAAKGNELLATEIMRAGLGRVKVRTEESEIWKTWHGRYHHMGTTRMHADSKHGVVDANCRVHSLSNLYIGGSSVFPTGGAGVPTLTIVALALRLADHLRKQLG